MKKKRITALILAVLVFIMLPCYTSAQYSNVSIFFDGTEIELGEFGAYYDAQLQTVMAPLYSLAETFGYTADYDVESGNIQVIKDTDTIIMAVGSSKVIVNTNKELNMNAPLVSDTAGNVFLPLGFLADIMNYDYSFNSENLCAYVDTKASYVLNIPFDEVIETFGQYDRVDGNENKYVRYIYLNDFQDYTAVDVSEGSVVSYFIAGSEWNLECGIFGGMKLSSCESLMKLLGCSSADVDGCQVYELDGVRYMIYYDVSETIYGVKLEYTGIKSNEYVIDTKVTSAFSQELNDLVNCYRKLKGSSPLPTDSMLSSIAKNHSSGMANGNYFNHKDSSDHDYEQRMKDEGYGECYVSEIIAEAYDNSIDLFSDLISDQSYVDIVNANYDSIGCGVAYNENADGLIYYTQLFYAAKD